jgi:glycosyltransferase involved in cell wall biosynthesis
MSEAIYLLADNCTCKSLGGIMVSAPFKILGTVTSMDKFKPLASIVIPVFNGANYMRQAIDSALAQTYRNIEVIVVNDGSKDNGQTDAIAKSYGDRIRYFSKENGGCASALNFGIAKMKGEYFSWLSHDDRYLPDKIEHQINVLSTLEDKETIIYGGYEVIDSKSAPLYMVRPDAILPPKKRNIPLLPLLRGLIHGCALLIPRKYFSEIGVFDESLPSTQDYALWFEFFRVAPLHFDSRIVVQSRVHPDQGTHKIEKHIEECNTLWSGFLRRLSEDEMSVMEGSPYRFLVKTAEFLSSTPYHEAQQLATSMAESALADTNISVVIPFYNRIGWAVEAIRSVQVQTHQQFEILLIDDGSTDDLGALLDVVRLDSRIKYIRQDNAGPAKARNNGVKHATGRYIAFLDSDDLFCPEKLEVQLKYMEENVFALSHTSYDRVDLEGNLIGFISSGQMKGNVFSGILTCCPIAMPTVMGRAGLFRDNPFPEQFEIGEDVCLWISLASRHELGGLDLALSKVRVGPETAALNASKQAIGLNNIASYILHDPYISQRLLADLQQYKITNDALQITNDTLQITNDALQIKYEALLNSRSMRMIRLLKKILGSIGIARYR